MSLAAFEAIRKIKSADVDAKAFALGQLKKRVEAMIAKRDKSEAALTSPDQDMSSIAVIQSSLRWREAQRRQLKDMDRAIAEQNREIETAEEELKIALSERRPSRN